MALFPCNIGSSGGTDIPDGYGVCGDNAQSNMNGLKNFVNNSYYLSGQGLCYVNCTSFSQVTINNAGSGWFIGRKNGSWDTSITTLSRSTPVSISEYDRLLVKITTSTISFT